MYLNEYLDYFGLHKYMCAIIQKRYDIDPILPDVQVSSKRKTQHFFVSRRTYILHKLINQKHSIRNYSLYRFLSFHLDQLQTVPNFSKKNRYKNQVINVNNHFSVLGTFKRFSRLVLNKKEPLKFDIYIYTDI